MSEERVEVPFGSWVSPITAEVIVSASVGLGGPAFSAGDLWWSELRPSEAGRVQIVRKALAAAPDTARDVLPDGFSARTRVHEYGGGAWWLHDDTLFFTNWTDQRLYRIDHAGSDDQSDPVAITPEPAEHHGFRFADGDVTTDGAWIVAVREWHGAPDATEARNEIVAIPTDGSEGATVLVGVTLDPHGPDFVSNPRVSPDSRSLCWLQWRHPDMPWDSTELWVGDFDEGSFNATPTIKNARRITGGSGVSIAQPEWHPDGTLYFVSDGAPGGFWNLHRAGETGESVTIDSTLTDFDMELASPAWVFGQSSYCFSSEIDAVASWRRDAVDQLGYLDRSEYGVNEQLASPFTTIEGLTGFDGRVAFIAASFSSEPEIATIVGPGRTPKSAAIEPVVHRPARDLGIDAGAWYAAPEHIEFPTTPNADGSDAIAYALFYPPKNPDAQGPAGELPPLIVMSHGGPTSAARPQLNLAIQFWTSRGFAVVDVNYRGSVGYGRAYRDALRGRWGIADVDDCIAAARFLASEKKVDGERLAIRGGSAGGYTTLCALTFHDDFTAGTSLYGVADLEALALDTHKFESRDLDGLVGPYPDDKQTYLDRSPIHHVDQLATPLLVLQGLEDEVVPPAQAEMMVAALAEKGVPHAYLAFEGEQHGFRQAPNIKRAIEVELYFYGRMFGFDPADDIEPIPIR